MNKMNFVFMLLCACLLNLSAYSQHKISTILENGSPEELYNIVVVAEAFTEKDMPEFERLANKIPEILKLNPTYAKLLDKINIYALHTPSVDNTITLKAVSPSANDPIKETIQKDTYFGIYFQNSYRAYFLEDVVSMKARRVAASHIPFADNVIIMVNGKNSERISGRASSDLGVSTLGIKDNFETNWEKYLLIHELAHALGGLSDAYSTSREEGFNKTINNDPESIRWKELLDNSEVGIQAVNGDADVYVPNRACAMTTTDITYFCPVCSNRLENVVNTPKYERINEIRKVNRTVIDDEEHVFKIDWEEIPEATSYEIAYTSNYFDESRNWKKEIHAKTVTEPSAVFDIEKFSASFVDKITIRAYNNKTSTNFKDIDVNLYNYDTSTIASPEITIEEITETSCKLSWTTSKYAKATSVRLRNQNGAVSEFVIEGDEIELSNLENGATYTIEMRTLVNGDYRYLYDTSESSEAIEINLLKTTDDKPKVALYPNPASEYIELLNDNLLGTVNIFEIFDTQGNLIRGNRRYRYGRKINIRNLRKGRYILKLDNGKSFQFEKK